MDKQEWSIALRSFSHSQRQSNSIPDRSNFSDEEEWQCRVIGGDLINWMHDRLPDILRQRMALPIMKLDPDPLTIFTTTMPGLAATQEIMPESSEGFVYLLYEEYEEWEKNHPVDEFTFHVHHWSYFCDLGEELLARARETYPSVSVDQFRIHSSGDLWGEQCGVFGHHLWRWSEQEMELLEEAFGHGVY